MSRTKALALVLLLWALPASAQTTVGSDDFNRANEDPLAGGHWTHNTQMAGNSSLARDAT